MNIHWLQNDILFSGHVIIHWLSWSVNTHWLSFFQLSNYFLGLFYTVNLKWMATIRCITIDDFVDRERRFDSMCNKASVDLESLELDEDSDFIQNLLKEFHEKTGSVRALDILQNWAQEKQFFIKVRVSVTEGVQGKMEKALKWLPWKYMYTCQPYVLPYVYICKNACIFFNVLMVQEVIFWGQCC